MKRTIGVVPRAEFEKRPRLFAALSEAFPLEFEPISPGDGQVVSAIVEFVAQGIPSLSPGALPTLRISTESGSARRVNETICLADLEQLGPVLRGRTLTEFDLELVPDPSPEAEERALATATEVPLWTTSHRGETTSWKSAVPLPELSDDECLRDRLRYGKFAALLPVLHFLRQISAGLAYSEPPLRACILIDDPNLHRPRYGYLKFDEVAHDAAAHNYHVAMATIPLDSWFASKKATEIFRRSSRRLSLLVHGNDHVHHELASFDSPQKASLSLAQALRRIQSFERRTGVHVSRIMAPPHGHCDPVSMDMMFKLGFDGLCISRPYPWLPSPPNEMKLAGWFAADFVAGGLAVIPRYHLTKPSEDLLLRAYLGQPLVLYGHHDDAANGLQVFVEAAEQINSLGNVRWSSLADISSTNYATRIVGDTMYVRTYSNRIKLDVAANIREIVLSTPPIHNVESGIRIRLNGSRINSDPIVKNNGRLYAQFPVRAGQTIISMEHPNPIDFANLPSPRRNPWPIMRRILTESRDRIRPLLSK